VEILGKITMKNIGAQPKPRSVTERKELCHIFGSCESFQEGSTTYGIFRKFEGRFEAVDVMTGEVFRSKYLLLPEIAEALLTEQLIALGAVAGKVKTAEDKGSAGTPGREPVEFAIAVGVKPIFEKDGKTIVERGQGYEYSVRPLVESRRADSLSHLRALSQSVREGTALPAPEPAQVAAEPASVAAAEPERATGTGGHRGRK